MPILRDIGIAIAAGGGAVLLLGLLGPAAPLQELPSGDATTFLNWPLIEVIGGLSALVLGSCMAIRPSRSIAPGQDQPGSWQG